VAQGGIGCLTRGGHRAGGPAGLYGPGRDLGPERANRTSSLAVALSPVIEMLEGHIDAAATNGVCWGTQSALATALSHFPELGTELELLGLSITRT
jgi:hypothetical protein